MLPPNAIAYSGRPGNATLTKGMAADRTFLGVGVDKIGIAPTPRPVTLPGSRQVMRADQAVSTTMTCASRAVMRITPPHPRSWNDTHCLRQPPVTHSKESGRRQARSATSWLDAGNARGSGEPHDTLSVADRTELVRAEGRTVLTLWRHRYDCEDNTGGVERNQIDLWAFGFCKDDIRWVSPHQGAA